MAVASAGPCAVNTWFFVLVINIQKWIWCNRVAVVNYLAKSVNTITDALSNLLKIVPSLLCFMSLNVCEYV